MTLFLKISHKLMAFMLFIPVWTDLILPDAYKSSELVFWIFCLLTLGWYYAAYNVLTVSSVCQTTQFKKPFYAVLLLLGLTITLQSWFAIDTTYMGGTNISVWRLLCYIFLAYTITKLLLSSESERVLSVNGLTTFLLVFVLPIGAWWIHQRVQKAALRDKKRV
ncbi:hypothetical protein [Fibrella forsythiae]|uniref:Uncharacterized protein n=1 Tax=Fibrella forsythiae TaxID=2817061 RepID=A0ABS3JEC7_9BACT|nr:hypothetical protein [Fibrella forsythiae]MBO0948357.1 hypothetical protein [Fibrella forsythiae]